MNHSRRPDEPKPLTIQEALAPIDPEKIEISLEARRVGNFVTASYLDVSATASTEEEAREKLHASWAERQAHERSWRARHAKKNGPGERTGGIG